MPRPKTNYYNHKDIFNGVNVINEKELLDDVNFNVNSKVIIECSNKHIYCMSVTKAKSLHKNPKECPHCLSESKYEQMGIEYEFISNWANKYNFSIVNVKKYYNRYTDKITVKCNKHDFTKEIKSVAYLEKNIDNTSLECPECNGKYKPLSVADTTEKIRMEIPTPSIELLKTVEYESLPGNFKQKLLRQTKWRLVEYTNTKNKCVYQCNICGGVKKCMPYNIFLGGGDGCLMCKKNTDSLRVCEKIKSMCVEYNFYPKNKLEYISVDTPIEFICNGCGDSYVKSWANLTGNYYKMHCSKCHTSAKRKCQTEFYEFIKSIEPNSIENDKTLISPYELDIVCHDKKVAFEFCGVIWHSTKFKNDRKYHKMKYDMCNKIGYRLITVFDDEWREKKDICKSRITSILGKSSGKIYARKCEIVNIDNNSAREFFNNNHIQGTPSKAGLCFGLKHNGSLVCMMSFAIRHGKIQSDSGQWELQRYAAIRGFNVTGGASRLLNHFRKYHEDSKIVTFSDNRWGDSEFYKKIGFTEDCHIPVDYTYCGVDTKWCRKHKFGFDKKKLIKKCISLGIQYSSTDTETTLSEMVGLYRVYDCGHKRYVI